jgi:hypothetical protein
MKRVQVPLFLLLLVVGGCAGSGGDHLLGREMALEPMAEPAKASRMLIWQASYTLEVKDIPLAVDQVSELARASGGLVEARAGGDEDRAQLTLRVPVANLESTMASLEAVGHVSDRHVSSLDVTVQYVDIDARLQTKIALRDRLRELLDRAADVQDILAIERELSRVQADIDSMQARLKALKGQVDMAAIEVTIKRKQILGPLGYVGKGVGWVLEKLFIIQH